MNKFWSSFFGSALGSLVAIGIGITLSVIIFFGIIGSIAQSADKSESTIVKDNSVLHLKLDYPVTERTNKDPFANFNPMNFSTDKKPGLNDLLVCIKAAKTDDKIKGIYLDFDDLQMGAASAEELRLAITDFRSAGKFVYSYSENLSQKAYYVVSAGDQVYIDPMGGLELKGLSAGFMSFKSAMDKIGVKAVILRPDSNKFKSAVEPFFLEKMSQENRSQTALYINSVWADMLAKMAESRKSTSEKLNDVATNLLAYDTDGAISNGLVDKAAFKDEFWKDVKIKLGIGETDKISFVKPENYIDQARKQLGKKSDKKIAVLYATGSISNGKAEEGAIGSTTMSESLKKIREDESIKALVLRINSPGGSAQASEIIWHELELTRAKMPIIVSMGDYAASGGYYIACNADTIVADNTTLTGSIGVFGLLVNTKELFENKIGLKSDTVNTNANADFYNTNRDMSEVEQKILTKSVNKTYQTFLKRVADGRGMTTADVDKIAQGRIWSGVDAKRLGLVDVLGGFDVALDIAAKKAGLEEYELVEYPKQENTLEKMFSNKTEEVVEKVATNYLGEHYKMILSVKNMELKNGVQARMPYSLEVR